MGVASDVQYMAALELYQRGAIDRNWILENVVTPHRERVIEIIDRLEKDTPLELMTLEEARMRGFVVSPGAWCGTAVNDEAVKYDDGKVMYDLLPAQAIEELAKVYTFGAKKYSRRNWEKGFLWCRVFAAMLRHSFAWMRGETLDPESGLHHMAHAAFGCLALVQFHYTGKGKDDRKEVEEVPALTEVAELFPEEGENESNDSEG